MEAIQNSSSVTVKIKSITAGDLVEKNDELAVEEPLEIQLQYIDNRRQINKNISVTMRTPGNDEELATGFLFTEGIFQNAGQIDNISHPFLEENKIRLTLHENVVPLLQNTERNFYTTSSCGVCGKASIDAIKTVSVFDNEKDDIFVDEAVFYSLPQQLRSQQFIFENTGGLHASALFSLQGNFIQLREDVGRHNALDKLIGAALLANNLPLNNCILLLSGRASFELIQKAVMAGIKIVAAIGAPSSLAVQLAHENGITLIGFLKEKRYNIYSGVQRIKCPKELDSFGQ